LDQPIARREWKWWVSGTQFRQIMAVVVRGKQIQTVQMEFAVSLTLQKRPMCFSGVKPSIEMDDHHLRRYSFTSPLKRPTKTQSATATSEAFLTDGIHQLMNAISASPFMLMINDHNSILSLAEGILLSPHAKSAPQTDIATRWLRINDTQIESNCFSTIVSLIRSANVKIVGSSRRSQILLSCGLEDYALECLFFNPRFEWCQVSFSFIHSLFDFDRRSVAA
jgi:hypothetical protein